MGRACAQFQSIGTGIEVSVGILRASSGDGIQLIKFYWSVSGTRAEWQTLLLASFLT